MLILDRYGHRLAKMDKSQRPLAILRLLVQSLVLPHHPACDDCCGIIFIQCNLVLRRHRLRVSVEGREHSADALLFLTFNVRRHEDDTQILIAEVYSVTNGQANGLHPMLTVNGEEALTTIQFKNTKGVLESGMQIWHSEDWTRFGSNRIPLGISSHNAYNNGVEEPLFLLMEIVDYPLHTSSERTLNQIVKPILFDEFRCTSNSTCYLVVGHDSQVVDPVPTTASDRWKLLERCLFTHVGAPYRLHAPTASRTLAGKTVFRGGINAAINPSSHCLMTQQSVIGA